MAGPAVHAQFVRPRSLTLGIAAATFLGLVCPHCRQVAPIVYRGVSATCTACGRPRLPLASNALNLAGRPSKWGGTAARVLGWLTLAGGWLIAAVVLLVLWLGLPSAAVLPWVVSGVIAAVSTFVATGLLRSGKELMASGAKAEQATRMQAVLALAAARGGAVTAWDVAHGLALAHDEAEALLTALAKAQLDLVHVDIDDAGQLVYRVATLPGTHMMRAEPAPGGARVSVAPDARAAEGLDVVEEPAASEAESRGAKARSGP